MLKLYSIYEWDRNNNYRIHHVLAENKTEVADLVDFPVTSLHQVHKEPMHKQAKARRLGVTEWFPFLSFQQEYIGEGEEK